MIGRIREWWRRRRKGRPHGPRDIPGEGPAPVSGGGTHEVKSVEQRERERYADHNFMHFGREDGSYPAGIDLDGARELLELFGSDVYGLEIQSLEGEPAYTPPPLLPGSHICDFCGRVIAGAEYQVLRDGRERCMKCSRTVVRGARDVKRIFREVKRRMEHLYGIKFENDIGVQVVSAKKLHRLSGDTFVPTSGFDARAVGFAVVKRGRQSVVLENGSPRTSFISTIAHELTHCWQNQIPFFMGLGQLVANGTIDNKTRLVILEGHATWAEVQYLFLIGEAEDAQSKMDEYLRRNDEYGMGFRMYMAKYGFSRTSVITRDTPFDHPENPLG